MSHIKLICFSRDRAPQLDLLLRSLALNAPIFSPVVVIYKATTPEFQAGYDELMNRMGADLDKPPYEYPDKVIFHRETDFRDDVLFHTATAGDLVCYVTDDSVAYRKFDVPYSFIDDLVVGGDVTCLSLRIGIETTVVETYDVGNPAPKIDYDEDRFGVVYWNIQKYPPHSWTGYAYSLDGHIFWRQHILDLMSRIDFSGPNALEGNLAQFSHQPGIHNGYMAACKLQHLVSSPVNSVAGWNRSGGKYPSDHNTLNDLFLSGFRIDLDEAIKFCLDNCVSTHLEIPYILQNYNGVNT